MSARNPRRTRGIMLVEILLALAITGLVATGVASLLFTVAGGTKHGQELRRRNVRVDVLSSRIDSAIRSSCVLLGRDSQCLVFWIADTRHNQKPNLSELSRLEWDPATRQLKCYQAPADLSDADDIAYDLSEDFLIVTAGRKGTTSFPSEIWSNVVTAWDTTPADATRATRLIGYHLTIDAFGSTHSSRSAAALRGESGLKG